MRNESAWKATKFVRHGKAWRASRDRMEVAASSLLIADISVRFYQEALEGFASGRLIDLGCGKAPLYGIYRSRVDSVVCVDWPYGDHGSDFVDHQMDLNGRLAFSDSSFGTVLADVLEHVRNADMLWSEMTRICSPGGRLIIGTPFLYWIHEDPHDYWRYTHYCLQDQCDRLTNPVAASVRRSAGGHGGPLGQVLCESSAPGRRCRSRLPMHAQAAADQNAFGTDQESLSSGLLPRCREGLAAVLAKPADLCRELRGGRAAKRRKDLLPWCGSPGRAERPARS